MPLFDRLRTRLGLELDRLDWHRQCADLRAAAVPTPNRRVLVCDLMYTVANAKIQAVLIQALRCRGYAVDVLLDGKARPARAVYAGLGDVRFLDWQEIVTPALQAEGEAAAARVMAEVSEVGALLDLQTGVVRTGRNAVSTAVRRLRQGSVDLADPEHRQLVEALIARSVACGLAAERMVEQGGYDLALFCERGYTPAGEVFDACMGAGVDVVQWCSAPQAGHYLLKRYNLGNRDQHPLSLDPQTWEKVRRMPWTAAMDGELTALYEANYQSGGWYNQQQLQVGKRNKSRDEICRQLALDPAKPVAVIFAHILYDATFFYGTSLFEDYRAWLVESVRAAIGNPNLNWVVKVHPVNVWRSRMDGQPMEQLEAIALREEFGELPAHVRIMPADTDINTYALFEAIDYGLTVRGTIGMELPCFGIPTVLAGTGRYSHRGFTLDPETAADFHALLARLHEVPRLDAATVELARRHAYGTFFMRPIPIDYMRVVHGAAAVLAPALSTNTRIEHRRRGDFAAAADIAAIADWLASDDSIDMICRPPAAAVSPGGQPAADRLSAPTAAAAAGRAT